MIRTILAIILFQIILHISCFAQADTALTQLQNLPKKYIATVDKKVTIYTRRITGKTEKTLTKLLQIASPETAQRFHPDKELTD